MLPRLQAVIDGVVPGNERFASAGRQIAGEQAHGGGFACAVWSQQPHNLPWLAGEGEVGNGRLSTISLG